MSSTYSSTVPAISFSFQPGLRQLFEAVVRTDDPVTIICGAGVSSDAGLPDWHQLVEHMCQMVPPDLRSHLANDSAHMMRRVDYILRLAQESLADRHQTVEEIVRKALYQGLNQNDEVLPGHLANAIAQLTSALQGRVRIITTNFDDQLEAALESYYDHSDVLTLALADTDQWRGLHGDSSKVGVLHVHGAVGINEQRTRGEVVLSEARFQRFGADVQDVIKAALEETHVIFVGVSMTDPNLVGPLRRLTPRSPFRSFMLFVPDHLATNRAVAPKERRSGDAYVNRRNEYFRDDLNLELIILKSYSQVQQVFLDLGLALHNPDSYFSSSPKTSARYGFRMKRALGYFYGGVGLASNQWMAKGAKAREISDYLNDVLVGPGGPKRLLNQFARNYENAAQLSHLGLDLQYLRSEDLALFLWLRAPDRLTHEAHYCLRLIGNSAYSHRNPWSGNISTEVCCSEWPAAVVAFKGRVSIESLVEGRRAGVWKSTVMVPIRWTNKRNDRDTLLVGVLALNSTRQLASREALYAAAADGVDVKGRIQPSILGLLDINERRGLQECLGGAARRIIAKKA